MKGQWLGAKPCRICLAPGPCDCACPMCQRPVRERFRYARANAKRLDLSKVELAALARMRGL